MTGKTAAVLIGLLLSAINFAIFVAMSAWALKRKTTTAFAAMAAGFVVRLAVVTAAYVYFVMSATWGPLIYWISAGFIPGITIVTAAEVFAIIRMEKGLTRLKTSDTKASVIE